MNVDIMEQHKILYMDLSIIRPPFTLLRWSLEVILEPW